MKDNFTNYKRKLPDSLIWWPLFFALGIATFFALPYDPAWWITLIGFISAGLLFLGIGKRAPLAILMLILFIGGFGAAQWRTHMVAHTPWDQRDRTIEAIGTIKDVTVMPYGVRYMIGEGTVAKSDFTFKNVRLVCRACDLNTTKVGDIVQFRASLMKPAGRARAQGFDFQRTAYFNEVSAVGFIYGRPEIMEKANYKKNYFSAARQTMSEAVDRYITDKDTRALALALLTGVSSSLPDDLRNAYQSSGLAHIYSVSGLHLSFVAGFLFFVFRAGMALFPSIALKYPIKKVAAFMALIAVTLFTLFAGDAVPTWRALFMTSIVLLAVMVDRSAFTLRTIAFVAMVIMIWKPELLLSISFQLSFAAVTVLVAWMEWVQKPNRHHARKNQTIISRHGRIIREVMVSSLLATLATLPFIIGSFGRLSIYAVVANMVGVPLTGFLIMPLIVVALVITFMGGAGLIMPVLSYPLKWLNDWAYSVGSWPYADIRVPVVGNEILILCGIALYLVCAYPRRWTLGLVIISYLGLAFLAWRPITLPQAYISEKGLVGFVAKDILWVTSKTKDKFVRNQWLGQQGLNNDAVKTLPREGEVAGLGYCDRELCIFDDVALIRRTGALPNACANNDIKTIIATEFYIKDTSCPDKNIIDKRALKYKGHMTLLNGDITIIKPDIDRVWTR